jgi:hypothetical protein
MAAHIVRLATAVWHTSLLPRDAAMINPVVHDTLGELGDADWQAITDEWATAFKNWSGLGTTNQIQVKAYDCEGPKPHYPLATTTLNPGTFTQVGSPREIAVCLSFWTAHNVKRERGRLYIPFYWLFPASSLADRPSATVRQKVGDLAQQLQDLGGLNMDWSVYSKKDGVARAVSHWWVDDEWDTQRRRGLRATTRLTGVTSE